MSSGDKPTIIDLDDSSTTLIVGANGSGKSTMLDALSFGLFNKPHRKINRPQLVNSVNNKKCVVEVEFEIGSTQYKIIRGMKPNIFEIWQDGRLLNQESHSRDYQQLLEVNILKLNHKSFHQVVVLGAGNFIPFMELSTYHRRGVIEDLLDISVFTKMNILLKENAAKQKELIKDTEHQVNLVSEKIKLQTKHLSDLQQIDERNAKLVQTEIDELNKHIAELSASNSVINEKYSKEFKAAKKDLDKQQASLNKLTQYEHGIKFKIKTIVEDAKFYECNDVCPTCNQDIAEETKSAKLHTCKTQAVELNTGYEELKKAMADLTASFNSANVHLNEISKLPNQITANNNIINSHNTRVRYLNKQLQTSYDSADSEKAQKELTKLREKKDTFNELRLNQIEDRAYNEIAYELLKDTGIKTKIIKQYLPVMNKLINQYLHILDFFVSFNLDESFNETIKSRHCDYFTYASFSEGEKARINLSLMFAWRHIAKMKNSANTNLLILDEVMDGSVDGDGIECFMKIISELDPSTRTFIISHKQEYSDNKFDRCLRFEKVKNFSRCEII